MRGYRRFLIWKFRAARCCLLLFLKFFVFFNCFVAVRRHSFDDVDKRLQYLDNYEAKEGIRLDPSKIQVNPGCRSLAKMMLNSFWGKYGQQGNKRQVQAYTSPSEFFDLVNDDTKEMQTLRVVNQEMVKVVYKNVANADKVQVNISISVACFTTCWARLKLYQEGLSQLEPTQVLYFDTDSIIYSRHPRRPSLPLGDYLGDFTDELKDGDHIIETASAGPKNYGYVTKAGKVECKVRGFSLSTRGQGHLNFRILKEKVMDKVVQPLQKPREIAVFNPQKIVRDVNTKQLETLTEIKRYKLLFDKRVVDPVTSTSTRTCTSTGQRYSTAAATATTTATATAATTTATAASAANAPAWTTATAAL